MDGRGGEKKFELNWIVHQYFCSYCWMMCIDTNEIAITFLELTRLTWNELILIWLHSCTIFIYIHCNRLFKGLLHCHLAMQSKACKNEFTYTRSKSKQLHSPASMPLPRKLLCHVLVEMWSWRAINIFLLQSLCVCKPGLHPFLQTVQYKFQYSLQLLLPSSSIFKQPSGITIFTLF